jgi:xanthine dehydrogenase accessory factor
MDNPDLFGLSQDLRRQRRPHAWITVVAVQSPSSAYVGAQAIVEADGEMHGWIGGGCVQGVAREAALQALARALPRRLRIGRSGDAGEDIDVRPMACASGGEVELFIQPLAVTPRLRIYGSTPVARAAAWLARQADFDPLTDADAADSAALDAARAAAGKLVSAAAERERYALVATQGDGDEAALEDALRSSARAVLVVASRRKAQRMRATMTERGIAPERLAVIRAPAGPNIGAVTPNEIALAAVGGLIAARRGLGEPDGEAVRDRPTRTAAAGSATTTAAHQVGYVNPVCGAVVDPATALSSLTRDGQTHYFCCTGCRVEFERDPDKYLRIAARMGQHGREPVQ